MTRGRLEWCVCQDADLFTKPLDIQKFREDAKTDLNVV